MSKQLRSPIVWFGGKGIKFKKIQPYLLPLRKYIEVFGGGASVLCAKEPCGLEVYNDLNNALYEFFTVISKEALFEKFYRRVAVLPLHRTQYNDFRAEWKEETDIVERVSKWFVVARQSFSGQFGASYATSTNTVRKGMAKTCSAWLSAIESLPEIHKRLQRVQFENQSFESIFERYDSEDAFFYCDPPYVSSTRKSGGYENEMTEKEHLKLIDILNNIKGRYLLSGYNSDLYENSLRYRNKVSFDISCSAAGRVQGSTLKGKGSVLKQQKRVEVLWMNYNI